ncbi:MAG: site-2 protease family protein [Clostridiales bacterium]|nr:site-2 protease family protein [Clostridiales bacterium]
MLFELFKSGMETEEIIRTLLVYLFALTLAFAIHEFMHAAAATYYGDDTPALMGRLTLNPLAHLHPVGTVMLLIMGFGWGKPVQYNPNNLTRYKSKGRMRIGIALAGVIGNFLLALVCVVAMAIMLRVQLAGDDVMRAGVQAYAESLKTEGYSNTMVLSACGFIDYLSDNYIVELINMILYYIIAICTGLFAFNLIPIPPLDGYHLLDELIPVKWKYTDAYRNFMMYAPTVLFVIIILGNRMTDGKGIIGYIMDIIAWPIIQIFTLVIKLIVGI